MNLKPQTQSISKRNELCPEDTKADLMLPCFRRGLYEEPFSSYQNGPLISHLLRKTIHNKQPAHDNTHLYLSATSVSGSSMEDWSNLSSKDNVRELASPAHSSSVLSNELDCPLNEHVQAKRARVENIIRGMAGSPSERSHGEEEIVESESSRLNREVYKESKRKQKLPQHQEHLITVDTISDANESRDEECHKLREQLQSMQRLLHQLQEKFLQMYDNNSSENNGNEDQNIQEPQPDTSINSDLKSLGHKDKIYTDGHYLSFTRDQNHHLQEMLKFELSRAINQSVNTVFRKLSMILENPSPQPRLCQSQDCTDIEKQFCGSELSDSEDTTKPEAFECYESTPAHSPEHQTEALSLVVRKSPLHQLSSVSHPVKRPYPMHQSPFQFSHSAPLHDSQILQHLLKYGPHANFPGIPCLPPSIDRPSPDSVTHPWESIALRSKVNSGHLRQHHRPGMLGQVAVDGLCLPHVKMECGELQSMAERNTFMSLNIQEGLTPNHLKKAKLMFFYTRYPSSNILKVYFPDVKFNRCITSQLIKWFSNFREFYYIQMEKFARQAIVDGVSDVKEVSVTRDSEVFRALNMHYNKANDFQVPDRFLEVGKITLLEFYNAISISKDSDPSWKKAIYKVICKLDSEVPEEFKSPSYF
ncbi:prospero homeobox protein 2 [Trichomycterus rosablanca]|uniref:prospero homeobox protein 2 n=1 Tax=Trichomycterus rosablanca TaxID=2290929 RepID=UPI002F354B14